MSAGRIDGSTAASGVVPVRAMRSVAGPVTPIAPVDAAPDATEAAALGRIAADPTSLIAPRVRSDQVMAREGAAAAIDMTVALERARAGLATLDAAAILDALDPVWSMESAPPSAWYLRAAALALLNADTEAEGVTLLARQRWPQADALHFATGIVLLRRGATDEAALLFGTLRARGVDAPWDAVERAMQADRVSITPIDLASITPRARLAERTPSGAVVSLATALRRASSGELADHAMSLARATSLGGDAVGDRHAMRKLVAAVFAVLSREGGGHNAAPPEGVLDPIVLAIRAQSPGDARRLVERLAPSPLREMAAQLVDAAESLPVDTAALPDRADAAIVRTERPVLAQDRSMPPAQLLWREGVRLLDDPADESRRVRWRTDGSAGDARTGWTPLPPPPLRIPMLPSARWGAVLAVLVVMATLSRCVVR
jgi:hypothetical protein